MPKHNIDTSTDNVSFFVLLLYLCKRNPEGGRAISPGLVMQVAK